MPGTEPADWGAAAFHLRESGGDEKEASEQILSLLATVSATCWEGCVLGLRMPLVEVARELIIE